MWIVVRNWDDCEASVSEFNDEEEALKYFESLVYDTDAKMYLAKVEVIFGGKK